MMNEGVIALHQPGLGLSPKMPHQHENKSFTLSRSQGHRKSFALVIHRMLEMEQALHRMLSFVSVSQGGDSVAKGSGLTQYQAVWGAQETVAVPSSAWGPPRV